MTVPILKSERLRIERLTTTDSDDLYWHHRFATRQRQGIASEALETVLDYLFFKLIKHRVIASIDPRNHASNRLLQKVGFRKEGHFRQSLSIDGEWVDDVLFGVLGSEWETIRK